MAGRLNSYTYTLLGVVGLVAVVAVFIIIKLFSTQLELPQENTLGQTSVFIPPTFTLAEEGVQTYALEGTEHKVALIAVFPPDQSGRESALFTVDGVSSHRMYEDTSRVVGDVYLGLVEVGGTDAAFTIHRTAAHATAPPHLTDSLFTGSSAHYAKKRTYALAGTNHEIELESVQNSAARFIVNGALSPYIPIGSTSTVGQSTITVIDVAERESRPDMAVFILNAGTQACTQHNGQNSYCRGGSACCGGQCVQLPDCTGKADGPVFKCGDRQMYCCNKALSLRQCGVGS